MAGVDTVGLVTRFAADLTPTMSATFCMIRRKLGLGLPAVGLGLAVCLSATNAGAVDWAQWRGPQRNGISPETGWLATFPEEGPKVLWKANVGLGFASVTVAGGRAFTTGNEEDKDSVFAFDAVTGKALWRYTFDHPVDAKYYEGGTSASPTVDGDRVYTLSKRGHLHVFEAATGAVVWKKNIAEEVGAKMPTWGWASSVLVDGDQLVVNVGTLGVALTKSDGQVRWKTGPGESGYATPVPYEQDGEKLYLVFAAKELAAIRADTGARVWSHKWQTSYDVNAADPVVVGPKRILVSSGYDRGGALLELRGGKPEVVWENKNVRSMQNAGIVLGDYLYAIDGNNGKAQLRCLEVATGKVLWTFKDPNHGALTAADGRLIVIGEKGELFVGEAKPEGFTPSARAQVSGGKFWTVPVLANGRLYIRNSEGLVTCLEMTAR